MPSDPPILGYFANEKPTRSDWYVALFTVIAAIAGLIGFGGIACVVVMWIKPAWFNEPEPLPRWLFAIGFAFFGGAVALSLLATKLAQRGRTRPAG